MPQIKTEVWTDAPAVAYGIPFFSMKMDDCTYMFMRRVWWKPWHPVVWVVIERDG